ncbi:MAG: FGGY-family carbohydrate kinase [Alsobacter sp.]
MSAGAPCTLGIDIGTYASKGVLVDRDGRLVASAERQHTMLVPRPGWAEHRPREDWWDAVVGITQELLARSGVRPADVAAVGTSAIGPCMLPVDAAGEPLMNAVLYGVDGRAQAEIDELDARIGAGRVLADCGNALTSQSVGPKILWLKRNRPEIYAAAHRIVGATPWIVHRLTGRWIVDHYSAASCGPLYRVDEQRWTDHLAPDIVPLDRLPELGWTTDVAGRVSARAAAETGLAEGTPVIVGTIDAAAEALSVGVRAPGDLMIMYGSTIFMILVTPERVKDPRLWYAPWLFPGWHASMAGLATSGTLTHWFRDQLARDLPPEAAIPALAAEAAQSPPGARGLVLLPYFSGERTPIHDSRARGVLFGLTLAHERADIARALFEGIAFGTNHALEALAESGHPPRFAYAVGGGTRNAVWSQATSDIAGLAQVVRETTVGASYGDAFLAAIGVGLASLDDIERWNPVTREIRPDPARRDLYRRQEIVFRELYARTGDLMHGLAT